MGENNPRTINRRMKELKNQEKPNLEETEVVNRGDNHKIKRIMVDVYLQKTRTNLINSLKRNWIVDDSFCQDKYNKGITSSKKCY